MIVYSTHSILLKVDVVNKGEKAGKYVVQVYCRYPSNVRPRSLVGFRKTAMVEPGGKKKVEISIPLEMLKLYTLNSTKVLVPGEYEFEFAHSVAQVDQALKLVLGRQRDEVAIQ